MFKKSLLALSVASVTAFTANAGILSASIDETAAVRAAAAAGAGAATDCAAYAATYNATVDLNGNTVAAPNDTITVAADAGTAGEYETTANVMQYTGADACTLTINSDVLVGASTVSNSLEGAQANGVTLSAKAIAGVGGYTAEDTIRLTVTGGVIDEDASASATLTSDNATASTFQLLGVVGNEILFTVVIGQQSAREIISIAGIVVTPNDGVTELSVNAETQNTANVVYDQSPSEKLTVLEAQYSGAVETKFDGVIDVATARLTLSDEGAADTFGAGEAINQDTTVFSVVEETTQGNLVPDSATFEIKGNFAWMAQLDTSDDDTAITSAELENGFAYAPFTNSGLTVAGNDVVDSAAINSTWDTLTVTLDTTAGADDLDAFHRFNWIVPGNGTTTFGDTSLEEQMFTATVSITDDSAASNAGASATVLAAGTEFGEWKLNGSVVTVPYMPFGDNTKVILRHTNTGVQTGDIAVRYMIEDNAVDNSDNWSESIIVGTSSRGVQDIRDLVIDAIMADAGVTKGKVAIEITTNVPEADVTVYAGYNVKNSADDRGFVGTFGEHGSAK